MEKLYAFLYHDFPPYPNWLQNLLEGFADPNVGCVGGPSILDYQELERPAWLCGDLQGLLSGYTLPFDKNTEPDLWEQFPLSCIWRSGKYLNHLVVPSGLRSVRWKCACCWRYGDG